MKDKALRDDISALIEKAGPQKIDQYLGWAGAPPRDDDKFEMLRDMIEMSSTPWQAASARFKTTLGDRSLSCLFYHARNIHEELCNHFGRSSEEIVEEIEETGRSECLISRGGEIKKACKDKGLRVRMRAVWVIELLDRLGE